MVVIIGAYFSRVKKGSDLKIPPKKIFVASIITIGVLFFTVFGVIIIRFRVQINMRPILILEITGKDMLF
jgi:hypothetical protein